MFAADSRTMKSSRVTRSELAAGATGAGGGDSWATLVLSAKAAAVRVAARCVFLFELMVDV
jgi:hypothetical protein